MMPPMNPGLLPPEVKAMLIKAAERSADEDLYADLVIDQIAPGDDDEVEMKKLLADDATFVALLGDIPAALMPWFVRLREVLLSDDEEEPAPAPAPAPVPATTKPTP